MDEHECQYMFRDQQSNTGPHSVALKCLQSGIEAAQPRSVVRENISLERDGLIVQNEDYSLDDSDRLIVCGGGNAAGAVAAELEAVLGDEIDEGVIVTDDPFPTEMIRVHEGTHPLPSERNYEHTTDLLNLVDGTGENDLVIAVISGGGSALLTAPVSDVTVSDLRDVTNQLLRSGADITEINSIRKHLSAIKGGRLVQRANPARVVGIVFSDVVGNDIGTIASGPTAPDDSRYLDAFSIVERYGISLPDRVEEFLRSGSDGNHPETPTQDSDVFDGVTNYILADGMTALEAGADRASELGYQSLILSSRIRGEAREAAKTQLAIAEECLETGHPSEPPVIILSGGETTVTVRGDGTGGPNLEFALSGALECKTDGIVIGSVDTDGIDGATEVAGAIVDANTVTDETAGYRALDRNNAYEFLVEADAVLNTGPTGTNVNDLRVLVIE